MKFTGVIATLLVVAVVFSASATEDLAALPTDVAQAVKKLFPAESAPATADEPLPAEVLKAVPFAGAAPAAPTFVANNIDPSQFADEDILHNPVFVGSFNPKPSELGHDDLTILDSPVFEGNFAEENGNAILENPVYEGSFNAEADAAHTVLENPSYEGTFDSSKDANILVDPVFENVLPSAGVPLPAGTAPALAGGFSAPGLKKIVDAIIPTVLAKVRGMRIPDMSGNSNGFAYSVRDIVVNQLTMGGITSQVSDGLNLGLNEVTVQVSAGFSFKKTGFPWLPFGSGRLDVGVTGSSIGALFAINTQQTPDGVKPQIRASHVNVNLNQVNIKISGSFFSWLYNLFIGLFKGSIKNSITNAVRDTFTNAVNVASDQVTRSMVTLSPVSNFGLVDLSLASGATYFNPQQVVALSFNGEVYPVATRKSDGVVPRTPFTYVPSGRTLDLFMSDFVINTACHAFIAHGSNALQVNKDTAKQFPVEFTTNAWAAMLPKTSIKANHADKLIDIEVFTASTDKRAGEPRVRAVGERFELTTQYVVNVVAVLGASRTTLFTTRLSLGGALSLRVENRNTPVFVPQIPRFEFKAEILGSIIGDVPVADIANVITSIVNIFILPDVNAKLLNGIPLPAVPGLTFTNTAFTVRDSYMVIASDINYVPPPMLMSTLESMQVDADSNMVSITVPQA